MIALVLALAAMFAQSPAERQTNRNAMILEAPNTRTIEKGDQSNIDDARQVLVRTDAEWTHALAASTSPTSRARGRFLEGDGRRRVHGQPAERRLQHRHHQRHRGQRRADRALYARRSRRAGGISAQILTFPFHLVAIPKAAVTDVKFEKVDNDK